jgi:hypothetical protein
MKRATLEAIVLAELDANGPDAGDGVCVKCGFVQGGVDPDSEGLDCEDCGLPAVYGMEQAVLLFLS